MCNANREQSLSAWRLPSSGLIHLPLMREAEDGGRDMDWRDGAAWRATLAAATATDRERHANTRNKEWSERTKRRHFAPARNGLGAQEEQRARAEIAAEIDSQLGGPGPGWIWHDRRFFSPFPLPHESCHVSRVMAQSMGFRCDPLFQRRPINVALCRHPLQHIDLYNIYTLYTTCNCFDCRPFN